MQGFEKRHQLQSEHHSMICNLLMLWKRFQTLQLDKLPRQQFFVICGIYRSTWFLWRSLTRESTIEQRKTWYKLSVVIHFLAIHVEHSTKRAGSFSLSCVKD